MNAPRVAPLPALVVLGIALTVVWGCNKKPLAPPVAGNQRPTVRITSAPLDTTARNYYVITLNWIGSDPDGRVDRFLFAVDPPRDPGADTTWEQTTENQLTRSFPCPSPDILSDPVRPDSSADFHVFVIKAVDNAGSLSPPVSRAFWSYTVAPRVEIRTPPANPLVKYYLPPAMLIRWEGEDPDGVFTQKPVQYKFKVLTNALTEPVRLVTARADPDSVRRYYAPRYWAGWDSLPGDTAEKQFTTLTPDEEYVFVVVAFDEAGAYSPIFSFNTNMVYFKVTFAGALNPRIGLYNDFFTYEYEIGSYRPTDPSVVIHLEVPAGRPGHPEDLLTFNWYADPVRDRRRNPLGCPIRSYRWAVDIVDVFDETQRADQEVDLAHWSPKSREVTSCRIGPYPGGESHRFYLEAEDICGLKSLGIVEFTPVLSTLAKPLLIVDDTRYTVDEISPNTNCQHPTNRPTAYWPTAAELDTFLYAVGGKPWRCYPSGTLSTPGIFSGYDYDTMGTSQGTQDLTVRLAKLGQYRNVIWIVDGDGALNDGSGLELDPRTALRYMNDDRRANTLAAYVRQGGRVWLAGAGAATASLVNFNETSNDLQLPPPRTMTFRNGEELVPGRFVHDQAHWRSEIKQFPVQAGRIRRHLGRHAANPGVYLGLPSEIRFKSQASDPFPPNRTGQPSSWFYQTQFDLEFLSAGNEILEDLDAGTTEDFQSTLDTLYRATSPSLPPDSGPSGVQSTVMTYYHGLDNPPFVFSGFNFWSYRRSDCKDLVDFVLQRLWDLTPAPPAPVARSAGERGSGGR